MLPCDICGKTGHSWFNCPQRSTKPAEWKPDRLAKKSTTAPVHQTAKRVPKAAKPVAGKSTPATASVVDPPSASSPSGKAPRFDRGTAGSNPAEATTFKHTRVVAKTTYTKGQAVPVDAVLTEGVAVPLKPGRGRPKSIDDMKAYKAAKARERRARVKAEKVAGK